VSESEVMYDTQEAYEREVLRRAVATYRRHRDKTKVPAPDLRRSQVTTYPSRPYTYVVLRDTSSRLLMVAWVGEGRRMVNSIGHSESRTMPRELRDEAREYYAMES